MKKIIALLSLFLLSFSIGRAQSKFLPLDKSPMDMAYYPNGYPVQKIQDKITEPLVARVIYSRPQKSGRVIFGQLLEYGKVWRLGANEATEIEFFKNVKVGGTKIKKGRYTMYCIPNPDSWTILFNKETDTWGSFKYDETKNVASINLPIQRQTEITEALAMQFDKSATGATLSMAWDDVLVTLPIVF